MGTYRKNYVLNE